MKGRMRKLIICAVILSLFFNITVGNYECQKVEASVTGVAAMGVGGATAIAVPPLAIAVGVAAIAVCAGGLLYSKNSFAINNAARDMWENGSSQVKSAWIASVKAFQSSAEAGEKVIDAAGNWLIEAPQELIAEAANYSGDLYRYAGRQFTSLYEAVQDQYNKSISMTSSVPVELKPGMSLVNYEETSGGDSVYSIQTRTLGEMGLSIHYFDAFFQDDVISTYMPGLVLEAWDDTLTLKVNDAETGSIPICILEEGDSFVKEIKSLLTKYGDGSDLSQIPNLEAINLINRYLSDAGTHSLDGPKPYITSAQGSSAIADTIASNKATAIANAAALGAPTLAIPGSLATSAQGVYGDPTKTITYDGAHSNTVTGAKTGAWIGANGQALDAAGRAAVDAGITWSIPATGIAVNTGALDVATTGVITDTGVGEKVNTIDDIVDVDVPAVPDVPGTGGVVGDSEINWKKLVDLGNKFEEVFPFSIPFVLSDYLVGSIDGIERSDFPSYDIPFVNEKIHVEVPKKFYDLLPFIRAVLLALFDISLLYAVHKWLGGLK